MVRLHSLKQYITANGRPFSVVICTGSEHYIAHGMVSNCDMTTPTPGILYGTTEVCQISEIIVMVQRLVFGKDSQHCKIWLGFEHWHLVTLLQ